MNGATEIGALAAGAFFGVPVLFATVGVIVHSIIEAKERRSAFVSRTEALTARLAALESQRELDKANGASLSELASRVKELEVRAAYKR